ncbi:MAG: T9SS type A sorting domain-containing protein [Bacteroidetes bacterium]|nr:T9SS type A sorting domain-containing protein [Bacteroidota bacterium]
MVDGFGDYQMMIPQATIPQATISLKPMPRRGPCLSILFAAFALTLGGCAEIELFSYATKEIARSKDPSDILGTYKIGDPYQIEGVWYTPAEDPAYAETGIATDNLRHWPWLLGAPVVDGDGIEGNYNLDGGDRPALMGDQMLWWVMNDAGNAHLSSGSDSPPIGMEVHVSAFAFGHSDPRLATVTFYRYKLIYKGPAPLEETYFSLYSDIDLGNFDDDYVGSDSTLHLGFTYNGDNFDEGTDGYGEAPPAIGYTFLRTPLAPLDGRDNDRDGVTDEPGEMLGMTSFIRPGDGGGVTETPQKAQDYYYYMQARWKNGRPLTLGGFGYDFSDIRTHFTFSGDPTTGAFWSEFNVDDQGTANRPGWRILTMSTGPFTMQPGDEQTISFAIVWARGDDHLDSVRRLKSTVRGVRGIDLMPDHSALPPQREPVYGLGYTQNFPNPFSSATTIRYSLPQAMDVRLTVFDGLGREVATLVEARQAAGVYEVPFTASRLPAGVYLYRIEMDHLSATRRMVLVR